MRADHPSLSRRRLLAGAASLPAAGALSTFAAAAPAAAGARSVLPVRGADLSFTPQLEAAGVRYRAGGRTAPVERILADAGATWMRLRVWVDPPRGYSTLASAVAMGRRARRAGMRVLLDLHYSDFWADPAHQTTPRSWQGQDLATLVGTVRRYTRHAVETMSEAGAGPDMVQVGNEVTAGMLWPLGQVYATSTPQWEGFTSLLRAGVAGVRRARVRGRRPRVMVHIDRGGDNEGSRWFFDHVLERGVDLDVMGQSYYPFWHGSIEDLAHNLRDTTLRYGRDVVVVETAYPWTLENGDDLENLLVREDQLPDVETWPASPTGQDAYFQALRDVLAGVPRGRALGFFAWEPGWVPGVGWTPGQGNPNDNLTMFDFSGRALRSLRAFSPRR